MHRSTDIQRGPPPSITRHGRDRGYKEYTARMRSNSKKKHGSARTNRTLPKDELRAQLKKEDGGLGKEEPKPSNPSSPFQEPPVKDSSETKNIELKPNNGNDVSPDEDKDKESHGDVAETDENSEVEPKNENYVSADEAKDDESDEDAGGIVPPVDWLLLINTFNTIQNLAEMNRAGELEECEAGASEVEVLMANMGGSIAFMELLIQLTNRTTVIPFIMSQALYSITFDEVSLLLSDHDLRRLLLNTEFVTDLSTLVQREDLPDSELLEDYLVHLFDLEVISGRSESKEEYSIQDSSDVDEYDDVEELNGDPPLEDWVMLINTFNTVHHLVDLYNAGASELEKCDETPTPKMSHAEDDGLIRLLMRTMGGSRCIMESLYHLGNITPVLPFITNESSYATSFEQVESLYSDPKVRRYLQDKVFVNEVKFLNLREDLPSNDQVKKHLAILCHGDREVESETNTRSSPTKGPTYGEGVSVEVETGTRSSPTKDSTYGEEISLEVETVTTSSPTTDATCGEEILYECICQADKDEDLKDDEIVYKGISQATSRYNE